MPTLPCHLCGETLYRVNVNRWHQATCYKCKVLKMKQVYKQVRARHGSEQEGILGALQASHKNVDNEQNVPEAVESEEVTENTESTETAPETAPEAPTEPEQA